MKVKGVELLMNNLFFILFLLSSVAIFVFVILSLIQFVKKDKIKSRKQLKLAGASIVILIISFIGVGTTADSTDTNSEKSEKIEVSTEAKEEPKETEVDEPKETEEERIVREQKEAEEKALAEQKAKEVAEVRAKKEKAKVVAEQKAKAESIAATWQSKVKEIATANGSPTEKYDAIMLYAKDYPSTDDEIADFEKYIINEYQSKQYLADITNDEYMLGNIFRANVINEFYGQVNSPINSFAFDFYQNTKYTYRGVDAIDSEAVKSNERQMNKVLNNL